MCQTLPVFLDCPFLIVRRVSPVSYVPDVAGVSGLSILDCRRFSPVSYVPDVAGVSGLSILDCPSVFSCVLCARCCRCFWIVHS